MSEIARVSEFELGLLSMPQTEIPVEMLHSHKVAARTIRIPKNTYLTGAIHKFSNLNFFLEGELLIDTHDGLVHMKAPCVFVSPAGTKRVGRTLTDCVWSTVFGTDETDAEKIVDEFTVRTEVEYLAFVESQKLLGE